MQGLWLPYGAATTCRGTAPPLAKPELRAFDAKTGEKVWSFGTLTGTVAAPITYELDGQQYVAVSVGGAVPGGDYYAPNYSRLLVFSLNGKATLPPTVEYTPRPLDPPANTASAEGGKAGEQRYTQYCSQCHGDTDRLGERTSRTSRARLCCPMHRYDKVRLQPAQNRE